MGTEEQVAVNICVFNSARKSNYLAGYPIRKWNES